jgi:PAS domain S-box-containing protein
VSIRKKLIILFLAIGWLPTLVVGALAYVSIGNELTAKTVEQIDAIATRQESRIRSSLQQKKEEHIRVVVGSEVPIALENYLTARTSQNAQALRDLLFERKAESSQLETIYITDQSGNVIASTAGDQVQKLDPQDITVNPDETSTATIREDADRIDKLFITSRVQPANGGAYMALGVYKLNDIVATLQDYTGLGATGETILAVKDKDDRAVSLLPMRFDTEAKLTTKLSGLHMFAANQPPNYTGTDYRGHEVIVVSHPVSGTDWAVATKIDSSEALAPIIGFRNFIVIIFVLTAVMILLIALYFTRYFTAPITALTEKTKAIMLGDFTQRIQVKASGEIGTLAETFNQMTDKLSESYQALEQKVRERTKDLEAAQIKLQESVKQDEALLASIGDGVIATDQAGYIIWINKVAEEMLKLGDTQVIGRKYDTLWHLEGQKGEQLKQEEQPIYQAITSGRAIHNSDYDYVRKDEAGKELVRFAVALTVAPVVLNGKLIGTVHVFRDVTHERQVDRMKTEFISLASHQLRTPLSAIRWFTEMLLSGDAGELSPEQNDFAHNIYDSADRMIELVNSLLNISRIESGRIIVDPKPTDLTQLVNGVVNDLKAKTEEKKQTLIVSVHKDLPKVNLDPRLIGQVYMNFLTNAIKYTPKGGEISVFVSRKGEELVSQITDNGYGIPKEQHGRVFQKFFRAENIVKVETDGTGLGLYLVKAIIESSGGRVWFESEEGKGTTFWFTLPMSGMKAKEGEVTLDA